MAQLYLQKRRAVPSIDEISTKFVIVKIEIGKNDLRLRFSTQIFNKAVAGDKWSQDIICTKMLEKLKDQGVKGLVSVAWCEKHFVDFFNNKHELPKYEPLRLFEITPAKKKPTAEEKPRVLVSPCGCVPFPAPNKGG